MHTLFNLAYIYCVQSRQHRLSSFIYIIYFLKNGLVPHDLARVWLLSTHAGPTYHDTT